MMPQARLLLRRFAGKGRDGTYVSSVYMLWAVGMVVRAEEGDFVGFTRIGRRLRIATGIKW